MNKHAEMKEGHGTNQCMNGQSAGRRLLGMLSALALSIASAGFLVFWSQTDSLPFLSAQPESMEKVRAPEAVDSDSAEDHTVSRSGAISDGKGALDSGSRKALENDIARSIRMMDNIRDARVVLALPEQPVLGQDSEKASASVVIDIGPELTLSPYQIRTILRLVAASVPKLVKERIILADQRGQLLNSREDWTGADEYARMLVYKKHLEGTLSERIVNILSPIVGADGVRAEVTVDLSEFSESAYSQPNGGWDPNVPGSMTVAEKSLSASVNTDGSLTPPNWTSDQSASESAAAPSVAAETVNRLSRQKGRKKAINGQAHDPVISHKPTLRRLSAAVVVDDKKMQQPGGVVQFIPYGPDEMERFQGLVKQAVGFDGSRGDQVTITQAAFKKTGWESSDAERPLWRLAWFYLMLKQLTAGLAIVLLFMYLVRPVVRHWLGYQGEIRSPSARRGDREQNRMADSNESSLLHPTQWQQIIKELPNDVSEILLLDTPANFQLRLEYLKKITDADARLVAEVIKSWVKNIDQEHFQSEYAALLMLSLGMDRAAQVIKHLSPRDVQLLGSAMAKVEDMSTGSLDRASEQLIQAIKNQSTLIVDKEEYIQMMMTTALGEEKAKSLLERILPETLTRGIEQFKWMDSQSVSEMIGKEHPQVIAIILSILDSEQAAEVIMSLPETLRSDVMVRIATLKGVQPAALRELDRMIEQQLPLSDAGHTTPIGGVDFAAHILNYIDSKTSDLILGQIADQSQELAWNIQEKMFVFDDLIHLDNKGMQTLLREISTNQLLLALHDAGEALKDKIFKNMSRRAAEMMREDLALMVETNPREVEMARKDILTTVKKLVDAGELKLKIDND